MSDHHEYASDEEVREAFSQVAREEGAEVGPRTLKTGQHPIPDPVPDWLVLKIEAAWRPLQEKADDQGESLDRDAFDREIRGRFEEQGILVDVKWWESGVRGCYIPEVEPYALTEAPDDDPDRQVYDVVNDTLGVSEKGWVQSGGGLWTP